MSKKHLTVCESMKTRQNDVEVKIRVSKDYEKIQTIEQALKAYQEMPPNEAVTHAFYFGTYVALTSDNFAVLREVAAKRDEIVTCANDMEAMLDKEGPKDGTSTH